MSPNNIKRTTIKKPTDRVPRTLLKHNRLKQNNGTNLSNKLSEALIIKAPIVFNTLMNQLTTGFGCDMDRAIDQVVSFHDNMIKNHNVVEGTARFNSIRLYAIKLLEGQNPTPLDRVAIGKKDRWPSGFDLLRPLFYRVRDLRCSKSDRAIRSILYLNRLCNGNDIADFSEIEKSFVVPDHVRSEYREHLRKHVIPFTGELITKPSTRVVSSGPNSKPKWLTADLEAYALMRSEIHQCFHDLCLATGNFDLYNYMKSRSDSFTRKDRARLRYITTVRDQGNKCRLVAISDYWTQVLLEPIMLDVQAYIKAYFHRVSYSTNHEKGFLNMKKYMRPGIKSYDITSWTDAFPSSLQLDFMTARYGSDIANAWYNLVVSCDWDVKHRSAKLKYQRGQGMGTNGSFDIASATDLLYLQMVYAKDYNKTKLSSDLFGKVGDDLWCWDPDGHVYNRYTQDLGISINMSKTKSSTEENLCGEFVSRSLNYNMDVSRVSARICRAVRKNVLDLPQLAYHLHERGYEYPLPLKKIINDLKIKGEHLRNVIRTLYLLCLFYPNPGLNFLRESLDNDFPEEVSTDGILLPCRILGVKALKQHFEMYSIQSYLRDIYSKIDIMSHSCYSLNSEEDLIESSEPDKYWNVREPIELLTSKVILSKSWISASTVYSIPTLGSTEKILSTLEDINQKVTFKELGVISSDGIQWRPKATKLFNFTKTLTPNPDRLQDDVFDRLAHHGFEADYLSSTYIVEDSHLYMVLGYIPHTSAIGKSTATSGHLTGNGK